MASGGSFKRSSSESRSFDFGSDDVLCSYSDFSSPQDQTSNSKRLDVSTKDSHDRVGRPLDNCYGLSEGFPREDVISAVDKCMKKYADNLMRQMEGISGRLTQLELCFYKLERSVSELQADMIHGQSEADAKLKSLEKHVHEVHRSIQIVRDKQELAETQMELAKLQLAQNEPLGSAPPKRDDHDAAAESKPQGTYAEVSNQQLALVPHQTSPAPSQELPLQQQPAPPLPDVPPQAPYTLNQATTYYSQHPPPPPQEQRNQPQYVPHRPPRTPQMLPAAAASNPTPQQSFTSAYQPQWQQPPSSQPLPRLQTAPSYPPPYAAYQQTNPIPETFQGGQYTTLQASGYGDPHPPQYANIQRQPPLPPGGHAELSPYQQQHMLGYIGGRAVYQPTARSHPYAEMIEKAVSMGYPRDQVMGTVQRIGEAGQPLDFNALLDGLSAHANPGPPQAWSR